MNHRFPSPDQPSWRASAAQQRKEKPMPKLSPPPDIVDEALALHDRGLWVVLCQGKVPINRDWPNTRLSREDLQVARRANAKLNIGIAWNQSDLIDVECDSPEAETALAAMLP